MKNNFLAMAGLCFGLSVSAHAQPIELPIGLTFDPPEQLDLTYQIIPAYDEKERVIAGWTGDELQYFIATDKLPPGYLDAQAYFSGMSRDLRVSWGGVETGKTNAYQTLDGMSGAATVFSKKSNEESSKIDMVVHFLTDGKQSFYAIGTVVPPAKTERVLEDTTSLFRTAKVSQPTGRNERSEDELVGAWLSEDTLPNGGLLVTTIELKPDLSFAANVRTGESTIFSATGVWSRRADRIHWEYLYSTPSLPTDKRKDEDQILTIDDSTVVLQSMSSGKKHSFNRAAGQTKLVE